jgi:Protein of unknown function (DUF3185)
MASQRVFGLVVLVLGLVIFFMGINATHSVADTVKEGVTGKFTDSTTWYILSGAALAVIGGAVAFFGGGRPSSV